MLKCYSTCLAFVLAQEGGWSDNPADPGGATTRGITLATFRQHGHPDATADDLHEISDEEVSSIYRAGYWQPVHGDDLPAGLDVCIFDFGVNAGPGTAVRLLQECMGVVVDGQIGPETMAAIKAQDPAKMINRVTLAQDQYYRSLPTYGTFGKGWSARVEKRRQSALAMVQAPSVAPVEAPAAAAALDGSGGLLGALKSLL